MQGIPSITKHINWIQIYEYLMDLPSEEDVEDYLDELLNLARDDNQYDEMIPVLLLSLQIAKSDLTIESFILLLATKIQEPSLEIIKTIKDEYNKHIDNLYLSCAFLDALGLMAFRNNIAREVIIQIFKGLKIDAPRQLLINSLKWMGRIEAIQPTSELGEKIKIFTSSSDSAVYSEAFYQSALLEFGDAMLSKDQKQLQNNLTNIRASFARALASEENRSDAALFVDLLDLFLTFWRLPLFLKKATVKIKQLHVTSINSNQDPQTTSWFGYQTDEERLLRYRIGNIADALLRASSSVSEIEVWTNFDEALVELAAFYCQIQSYSSILLIDKRLEKALETTANKIMAPRLGILLRSITRVRLEKVIEGYKRSHGEDNIYIALKALKNAAYEEDYHDKTVSNFNIQEEIEALSARIGENSITLINKIKKGLEEEEFNKWLESLGERPPTLSIDQPYLYGNDPMVDQTVRIVLKDIRKWLIDYKKSAEIKLLRTIIAIVQFVRDIRDDLPDYLICTENGGLGQTASEDDLQKDLFRSLRLKFGRRTVYESQPIAGGRSDNGLLFEDCSFPIEVKAEYRNIDQNHIHRNYIGQPDAYAGVRDKVSFLLILDLRSSNSAGHQKNIKNKNLKEEPYSLYSLDNSFWIDGLQSDPHLLNPHRNVIIVGLVPGNRPQPSGMTNYSERPKHRNHKQNPSPI